MTLSPGRELLLNAQSEEDFKRWIIRYAKRNRWRLHVVHDSRTEDCGSDSGWPDLFLVRGHRAVALEVKSKRGRLGVEQMAWLFALTRAGVEEHVVKPTDEDLIRKVLA